MSNSYRKESQRIKITPGQSSESDKNYSLKAHQTFYSTHGKLFAKNTKVGTVNEFKQNLEKEKNLRQLMTRLDNLDISGEFGEEKIADVLERNYKLQIQTLLEEVNRLKLEKKLAEKKSELSETGSLSLDKFRRRFDSNSTLDDSTWKQTVESKDSVIKELEFQNVQLRNENKVLKTRVDAQARQINEISQRLADFENMKDILEEKKLELSELQEGFQLEKNKSVKALHEVSSLKKENITLKLKSHSNSYANLPGLGGSMFNGQCACASNNQSFSSAFEKVGNYRTFSESKPQTKRVLNFSDTNDEYVKIGGLQMNQSNNQDMFILSSRFIQNEGNREERVEEDQKNSELKKYQNISLKVLDEYEKGIKNENQVGNKNRKARMLDRLIEVNKIKSFCIEAQNKKLLQALFKDGELEGGENVE